MKRFIINIEGADGVGKSTIAQGLVERIRQDFPSLCQDYPILQGLKEYATDAESICEYQHYPDYDTPIGQMISAYQYGGIMGDPTVSDPYIAGILYTADRITNRYHYNKPKLPVFTVNDRSYLSNFLYQGAKIIRDKGNLQEYVDVQEKIEPFYLLDNAHLINIYIRFPYDLNTLDNKEEKDLLEQNSLYQYYVSQMYKYLPVGEYSKSHGHPENYFPDKIESTHYWVDTIVLEMSDSQENLQKTIRENLDRIMRVINYYLIQYPKQIHIATFL